MPEEKEKVPEVPQFYSSVGDTVRKQYVWKSDYSGLEEVGEIDIQEEIDEAGKGRSTGEMVRRIMSGDTSALKPGEGIYADVSEVPESGVEAANVALAPKMKLEKVAQEKGITLAELTAFLEGLAAEPKAEDTKPADTVPAEKDGE